MIGQSTCNLSPCITTNNVSKGVYMRTHNISSDRKMTGRLSYAAKI